LNPNSRILSKAVFRRCLATVRSGNCVIEVTSEAESLGNVGLATTGDSHAVGEGRSGVIGNVDGESDGRITRTGGEGIAAGADVMGISIRTLPSAMSVKRLVPTGAVNLVV